jgi:hypothetical protein
VAQLKVLGPIYTGEKIIPAEFLCYIMWISPTHGCLTQMILMQGLEMICLIIFKYISQHINLPTIFFFTGELAKKGKKLIFAQVAAFFF